MANNEYPPKEGTVEQTGKGKRDIKIIDQSGNTAYAPKSESNKHKYKKNNGHTDKSEKNKHKAKWTIMIYMAVDDANGISEAVNFFKELEEIKNIVPALGVNQTDSRNLRIFLQAYTRWKGQDGQPGEFRSKRFEIDADFDKEKPLELKIKNEKLSMGSEEALSDFISWCQTAGEAEHYLLFLWGHGTGSSMFSLEESYESVIKLYEGDLEIVNLRTNQKITKCEDLSPETLFKDGSPVSLLLTLRGVTSFVLTLNKRDTKYFDVLRGVNDKPVTLIDLLTDKNDIRNLSPEIDRLRKFLPTRSNLDGLVEEEIRKCLKKQKNKIDILLIMGCCMQMVEFGYELRESRNDGKPFYYIASEELIYFDGYNYKDSFNALAEDTEMDPTSLAKRLVLDAPVKTTYSDYQRKALAISCVDLTKVDMLAGYLGSFADSILEMEKKDEYKEDIWDKIKRARKLCRHFGEEAYTYSFIDVTWFLTVFCELVEKDKKYPRDFVKEIQKIIIFLKAEYIVQPWIGRGRTPSRYQKRSYGGHGVAIYFPESLKAHNDNVMTGLGTAFDRNPKIGNGRLGYEKYPDPNEFTEKNSWYKFIRKYREKHGEISNYPVTGSLAPIDPKMKKLMEDKDALINKICMQLLEDDKVKTEVIPNFLLKLYDAGSS